VPAWFGPQMVPWFRSGIPGLREKYDLSPDRPCRNLPIPQLAPIRASLGNAFYAGPGAMAPTPSATE
jgi:hypothetical protein